MGFRWSRQNIDWFIAASYYTGFHHTLASHIVPTISPSDTMYDFGCGLGRIDIELSSSAAHITCVDVSEDALYQLTQDIKVRNITNITPVCADTANLVEKKDIGIMSFFGKSGQDMLFFRNLCQKKLLRIVNMQNGSTLYPQKHRKTMKDTAEKVGRELDEIGLPFIFEEAHIEFGQPLCSYDDAVAYVKSNAPNATADEVRIFLQNHLQETESKEYPLYLPNEKHLGIFIIS